MALDRLDLPTPRHAVDEFGALIGKFQGGDLEAFTQICVTETRYLMGRASRIFSDPRDREDMVWKTLFKVWRDSSQFNPRLSSGHAWLNSIFTNTCVDYLRSVRSRPQYKDLPPEAEEACEDPEPNPEDNIINLEEHRQRRRQIRMGLQLLPTTQAEAVKLTMEGLTQKQIAEKLKIPLGTAKTRVRLAYEKLRPILAPLNENSDEGMEIPPNY